MAKIKPQPQDTSPTSRAAHWRAVYADWEKSSLTQKEFCRQKGHSIWTFLNWRTKLKKAGRSQQRPPRPKTSKQPEHPGFAEVRVIPTGSSSWPVEIGLPDGTAVRISKDVDLFTLEMALRFVEGRRTC